MRNLYEILGIKKTVKLETIKKAYRKLSMRLHPDKNKEDKEAQVKFIEIAKAYKILSDPLKREEYDKFGKVEEGPSSFQRAVELLVGLFIEVLSKVDSKTTDVFAVIKKEINSRSEAALAAKIAGKNTIQQLKDVQNRISAKNKKGEVHKNLIYGAIQQQIEGQLVREKKIVEDIEKFELVQSMLEHLDYRYDGQKETFSSLWSMIRSSSSAPHTNTFAV